VPGGRTVSYPPDLPVSQHRDRLLAAIAANQVVIVAGETGSGKTTQLPKMCLELGRGETGMIGHSQPRRIAARSVAERIAQELGTELGDLVGYQVRFTTRVSRRSRVKVMTDGILLAEIQADRRLRRYDTLIIDEAHERSLNIDFILGYLRQLLPRRPDLKVIITSATIDPYRFSRHFDHAPVVEVSGRGYPVEIRYRPVVDPDDPDADPDRDQIQAICDAVDELATQGPGDILVFLSGEREIRDTADALSRQGRSDTEILPLYARLTSAEQHRVFAPHRGRRIILATNVAETSLTVPGVRYVVDPGTARISRYSHRLKVQRLPIEAISQASASQRAGRCGRVAAGVCIRLYRAEDFAARPEFTEPEILRTNLASVILQMTALDLGEVADFPFVDPPDRRNVADGVTLLHELGALQPSTRDTRPRLTRLGRQLAQIPIDPRLGRMVLAGQEYGCLAELLVIAAALSIQDPRERPLDRQREADAKHARFAEPGSDFLGLLNLWHHLAQQQRALSANQFRRMCRADFLNYLRVREWQDLEGQLREALRGVGVPARREAARPAAQVPARELHSALLCGLLSHIGVRDATGNEYTGARGAKFAIFPGSGLAGRAPRWVMAAELVQTARLWGRVAARIEPEWVEPVAAHLIRREYSEPHWDAERGAVLALEKVTLYGLPLIARRTVHFGRIDPVLSRELFIRHALVERDWPSEHEFLAVNAARLAQAAELEHRLRRRDVVAGEEALFAFYDARVGAEVVSAAHFDSWWKKVRRDRPDLLTFPMSLLVDRSRLDPAGLGRAGADSAVEEDDYPDHWTQGELALPLTYRFEPGMPGDGVTVHIPLIALNQLAPDQLDWLVPGLRAELVTALLRTLPKTLRRTVVPVADVARSLHGRIRPSQGPLLEVLADALGEETSVRVPREAWAPDRLPEHLRMNIEVTAEDGTVLGAGRDLAQLQRTLQPQARAAISAAAGIERTGLRDWDFDELPRVLQVRRGGHSVRGYPALVHDASGVAIRLFASESEQRHAMWAGTRRLLVLTAPSPVRFLLASLGHEAKLALTANPHGSVAALLDDCTAAAVDAIMAEHGGPAWDAAGFQNLRERVATQLNAVVLEVTRLVQRTLAEGHATRRRLSTMDGSGMVAGSVADLRDQLGRLIRPGFVTDTGLDHLADLPRYLQAMQRRLDRLPEHPRRDRDWLARLTEVTQEYREVLDRLPEPRRADADVRDIGWMIEELRVSYFAQPMRTAYPISDKRIYAAIDEACVVALR
jgi:ATP-dependent helicase HrpA